MNTQKLRKIYLLPNVITAFGLSCGLFVIFKMNMIGIGEVTPQMLLLVTGILLLASFADVLDGAVARAIKAESEFGNVFDSLADAISFGVAPSVIILKSLSIEPGTKLTFLVTTAVMVYSICGVLRLVRFNVSSLAARGNEELSLAHKKHFTGLPIPAAAAAAVSLNLFLFSPDFESIMTISVLAKAWILSIALLFLGYCMVSRWKFPSIKSLEIRVSSFQTVFVTVITAVFIFFGILHYFALVFLIMTWAYVALALSLSIARLIAGRKSKTLEEFEPDPEDEIEGEEEE